MTNSSERPSKTPGLLPWKVFRVAAHQVRRLSPHLVRVTLRGTEPGGLADLADNGYDQRIKLILPPAGGDLDELPTGPDWYQRLRAMPDRQRPIVRTYTVRAVRAARRPTAELEVDMVLHGVAGPASGWVTALLESGPVAWNSPRLQAAVLGPDARHPGPHGGVEFCTSVVDDLLLVGDETALPAIAAILERLPAHGTGTALIEVPTSGDVMTLVAPEGFRLCWLPRDGAACGSLLTAAATAWRPGLPVDSGTESTAPQGIRAWVAGEAGAVRAIRRHLVGPCGLPRAAVAFMGYWRIGRAEN